MARNISVKSIGFMIDELITTCLKEHHCAARGGSADLKARREQLGRAIDERLISALETAPVGALIADLATTLIDCWSAQEQVMVEGAAEEVARAAKEAQRLNAERNRLVREIDRRLGEAAITVTGKTYG